MNRASPAGTESFGQRLSRAVAITGRLCVGIDPHPYLLDAWNLPDSATGLVEFGLRVVDAAHGRASAVKPQVSFFERYGSSGFRALERVLAEANQAELIVIGDAKRGDIGTTMGAYADAWLKPGSPLEVDALTVSPYLGLEALSGARDAARQWGKGLFVLAATSNSEAHWVQTARPVHERRIGQSADATVAAAIVQGVAEWNHTEASRVEGSWGSFGVVMGATVTLSDYALPEPSGAVLPVLAPGFGEQGAGVEELGTIFGPYRDGVLVSESRSLLSVGPDHLARYIAERSDQIGALSR